MSDLRPDSQTPGQAAAAAVAPDALTANLLAKHAAGEKLTPRDYGKLGAFKASLKRLVGKPDGSVEPTAAKSGHGPILGAVSSAPGPAPGMDAPPTDPALIRRTTAAIVKQMDTIARQSIALAAADAGCDAEKLKALDAAAALPPASANLIADTSVDVIPDLLERIGVGAHNYPHVPFFGAIGLWGTNILLAVLELKRMKGNNHANQNAHQNRETTVPATAQVAQRSS